MNVLLSAKPMKTRQNSQSIGVIAASKVSVGQARKKASTFAALLGGCFAE